jgi:hypothetical protein
MKKLNLIVILSLFHFSCFCQIKNGDEYLIVKTEFKYNKFPTEFPISYSFIKLSSLNGNIVNDTNMPSPYVSYKITKDGGYYIYDSSPYLYTKLCCESGDVKLSIASNDSALNVDEKKNDEYEKVSIVSKLEKYKSFFLTFKDNNSKYAGEYKIYFWRGNIDFCACKIYMSGPSHPIFSEKVAYLNRIYNIRRLNSKQRKKVRMYLAPR